MGEIAGSTEALRAQLRRAGLRATSARVAVLRCLVRAAAPLSHAEVYEQVAEGGYDRATVYRNLVDLAEAGLAHRADLGDHIWRFEALGASKAVDDPMHPHFVCTECGLVRCLPDSSVAVRPVRDGPRALRRKGVEVQLRGRCDACA